MSFCGEAKFISQDSQLPQHLCIVLQHKSPPQCKQLTTLLFSEYVNVL